MKDTIHLAKFETHQNFAKNLQDKIELEKQKQEEVISSFKT